MKELIKKVANKLQKEKLIISVDNRYIYAGGVFRVVQIANKKPYATLTAFRKQYSLEKNKERNESLLEEIKALGLHAHKIIGFYKECPENNPECKDEDKLRVEEESFFVAYREDSLDLKTFIEKIVSLGSKYNQDSVMVGLPSAYSGYEEDKIKVFNYEVNVGAHYYLTSSGILTNLGKKVTPQKIEDYGSISVDPKKERKLEWLITGVEHPNSVASRICGKKKHIAWCEGIDYDSLIYINLNDL